jgi:hypothetical protein
LPVFLEISGARLIQVAGGGTIRTDDGLVAATGRRVDLKLGSLLNGERVKVSARTSAKAASVASIELPVRAN